MPRWLRFPLLIGVILIDDVLRELWGSALAIRDFFREHVRWVIADKRRAMKQRRQP